MLRYQFNRSHSSKSRYSRVRSFSPKHALSRNEFGDENIRAALFAELPENLVRHSGHRGQIKRKIAE
jgi:hypothetical protein